MSHKKLLYPLLFTLLSTVLTHATPSDKNDGKVVINLAGKQRMLTQKMSKEALLIIKGIEVQSNRKNLKETIELFDKTLHGLRDGSRELQLPATHEEEILHELDKELQLWNLFKNFLDKIVEGEKNKKILKAVEIANMPLLQIMNNIVGLYEKKYTSNLSPTVAKTINLAGRERMLIQKMTKELLLIANNTKSDIYINSLQTDGKLFQNRLGELMRESTKIKNSDLTKEIKVVKKLWGNYQETIANTELSPSGVRAFKKEEKKLITDMSKRLVTVALLIDKERYQINLEETEELFDSTLKALIEGDKELGIKKSSDRAIQEQLNKVQTLWREYQPTITKVDISKEGLLKAMKINMPLLKEMDKSVKLYEIHLK
jgi:hypothetical protein